MNNHPDVDVFGFGHCCIDHLCMLDPYPVKGKKGDVIQALVVGGGPVPTALHVLAKFGCSTRFCGKVGEDEDGRQVIRELQAGGIDTGRMIVNPAVKTAKAYIWIDPRDGARTVALDRTRHEWAEPEEVDLSLASSCKVFLTDGRAGEATYQALKIAREAGVSTVLDCGADRPRLREMLPFVDYAIVSHDFGDTYLKPMQNQTRVSLLEKAEAIGAGLIKQGVRTAIVTQGEHGAFRYDAISKGLIEGFPVKAFDTTGAGDVFHGGFIYGLLNRWNLDKTIRFANAAAALSCRKLSGVGSIPELGEVFELGNS